MRFETTVKRKAEERDTRYGLVYTRKRMRRVIGHSENMVEALRCIRRLELTSVKEVIELFLVAEPLRWLYASELVEGLPTQNVGVCQFYGTIRLTPLFWMNFSAAPLSFMYMHSTMLLRSMRMSLILLHSETMVSASHENLVSFANNFSIVGPSEADFETVYSSSGLDLAYCYANILIPELGKSKYNYYRVGVVVTREQKLSSRLVAVKKDGLTCCTFEPERVRRSSTRLFQLDNGWKLEFTDDQDCLVFKNLCKECFDHNFPDLVAETIHIPGFCEVFGYAESHSAPFNRPDTYISANGRDEFSRVMTRKTAYYDMDSEDEKWLKNFNKSERVSNDDFELIVDALEKTLHLDPTGCVDAKSAANRCPQDLGTNTVLKAVSKYWMKKRKQKSSPLLRIFRNYGPERAQPSPSDRHSLRHKRSLRRPIRYGGGKYRGALQEIACEQNVLEKIEKVEDVAASPSALTKLAIEKRRRAQRLMLRADCAVYRAIAIFRIAEAAQATKLEDRHGLP
ncbi:hypothetical protein Fmac_023949 [Flemingia macrophylla]|uniref:Enhancer of polycomb-like protein n=1 Tax=Flemingia macrophylla TaxID=520843 RepID=A0ABD1LN54_9FABA